jgi:hypothetical protein
VIRWVGLSNKIRKRREIVEEFELYVQNEVKNSDKLAVETEEKGKDRLW